MNDRNLSRLVIPIPVLVGVFSSALWLNSEKQPGPQVQRRTAIVSLYEPTLPDEGDRQIVKHCPLGMPKLREQDIYGPTIHRVQQGHVLELCVLDKIPIWVCEKVTQSQIVGDAVRRGGFSRDEKISKRLQSAHDDYTNSGLDRGHMAAAANRSSSQRLMDQTFRTTNIAPQSGSMNSGIWKTLEKKIRSEWIERSRPAYITSGPLYYDAEEEDVDTADGVVEYYSIGQGGVAVPTHFFKVILQKDEDSAPPWRAIAFVIPNRKRDPDLGLEDFIVSVRTVEVRTKVNFFSQMDDNDDWQNIETTESDMW